MKHISKQSKSSQKLYEFHVFKKFTQRLKLLNKEIRSVTHKWKQHTHVHKRVHNLTFTTFTNSKSRKALHNDGKLTVSHVQEILTDYGLIKTLHFTKSITVNFDKKQKVQGD